MVLTRTVRYMYLEANSQKKARLEPGLILLQSDLTRHGELIRVLFYYARGELMCYLASDIKYFVCGGHVLVPVFYQPHVCLAQPSFNDIGQLIL